MKRLLLIAVALLAVIHLATADEAADAIQKDRQAIAGTWKIESVEFEGRKPPTDPNSPQLTVLMGADGTVKVQRDGNTIVEATTKLDPSKMPKNIDVTYITGSRKGQSSQGIYEIDGDTFRVCTARSGEPRPSEFSSLPGSGRFLIAYKRVNSQ